MNEYLKKLRDYLDKLGYTLLDESIYGTYLNVLNEKGEEEFIKKPKLGDLK